MSQACQTIACHECGRDMQRHAVYECSCGHHVQVETANSPGLVQGICRCGKALDFVKVRRKYKPAATLLVFGPCDCGKGTLEIRV